MFNLILIGFFNRFEFIFSNPIWVQVLLLFVKREKIRNFQNDKMLIKIINYHKGLGKFRKFSRSRITKRTAPLNSSRKV